MADQVTVTSSKNYFQRVGNSIGGIFIGFILFLVAFGVLWWNEGNFVKNAKALNEGRGVVVELEAASRDAANDGALVHFTDEAVANGTVGDAQFGIEAKALLLNRKVEMYQWKEDQSSTSSEKIGGTEETTTTFTYSKDWATTAIDSSNFQQPTGHQNPGELPYEQGELVASNATVGDFKLNESIIKKIGNAQSVSVADADVSGISGAKINGNYIYIGDPANPKVGDVRVSFSAIYPGTISVIAQQDGEQLKPYKARSGKSIELVSNGEASVDEMFTAAEESNKLMTWVVRLIGFLMMWFGLRAVFGPLSMIFAVIPFFKNLVGGVVGLATFIVSLVLSSLTIAIAWFFYRPLISLVILVIAGGIAYLLKKQAFDKTAPKSA